MFVRNLGRKFAFARRLFRHMRFGDALRVLTLEILHWRSCLDVCIDGVSLTIRTHTSDLIVAISNLVDDASHPILVPNVRTIIDAGANIGTSAIAFARKHPDATIVAIEPEADNFAILERNVRPWSNIKPMKAAIAERSGEMWLLDRGTGPWGYTVTDSCETAKKLQQKVCCCTIRQILNQFGFKSVDILKLDIEGGERDILNSSDEWIGDVEVVVAELHDRITPGCTEAFNKATKLFKRRLKVGEKHIAIR